MSHDRKSHRKESMIRRMRRHPGRAVLSGLVVAALLGAAALGIVRTQQLQKARHISSGNSVNMGSGYRNVTYQGKEYEYNTLVRAILFAGLDSEGKMESGGYTDAPRADSINLVVLDEKKHKITVVAFDRDTMADMHRYTVTGKERGISQSHLCLAYTYGDGGKVSCENLREAVSELMGGVPVHEYVVTNRSSLPYLNDLVGGITVTVPNDDLEELYPACYEGAEVTLEEDMLEPFLRYRDTEVDFSNEGRLERQKAYIEAYIRKFTETAEGNTRDLWDRITHIDPYLQTSITRNKYLDMINLLDQVTFSDEDYLTVQGERVAGELHDEFYIDEDAMEEMVIRLFYEEV